MKSLLWFDRFIPLDDATLGVGAEVFKLPAQEFLDFGDANQAYITVEYWGVGVAAPSVQLMFQRSASREDSDLVFEDMMLVPLPMARDNGVHNISFGVDGLAGNKYPRGIGRFILTNTNAALGAAIRLRISVALVTG